MLEKQQRSAFARTGRARSQDEFQRRTATGIGEAGGGQGWSRGQEELSPQTPCDTPSSGRASPLAAHADRTMAGEDDLERKQSEEDLERRRSRRVMWSRRRRNASKV
ncbi:MAG: hypothetical protein ACK55Z_03835, partial [bacterium]